MCKAYMKSAVILKSNKCTPIKDFGQGKVFYMVNWNVI